MPPAVAWQADAQSAAACADEIQPDVPCDTEETATDVVLRSREEVQSYIEELEENCKRLEDEVSNLMDDMDVKDHKLKQHAYIQENLHTVILQLNSNRCNEVKALLEQLDNARRDVANLQGVIQDMMVREVVYPVRRKVRADQKMRVERVHGIDPALDMMMSRLLQEVSTPVSTKINDDANNGLAQILHELNVAANQPPSDRGPENY